MEKDCSYKNENTVIVVDDDDEIRLIITALLKKNGCRAIEASNGKEAVKAVEKYPDSDLVIMDIMMPHTDGISACREIRAFSKIPILFLTAKSEMPDKNEAYASGGDDFLAKPFSSAELIMKVNSIIRRYRTYNEREKAASDTRRISLNRIVIEQESRSVFVDGVKCEMTDKEYAILLLLCKNATEVFSPENIYETVWEEKYLPSSANTVMVHILNLRKKLSVTGAQNIIRTVWGKGYTIEG